MKKRKEDKRREEVIVSIDCPGEGPPGKGPPGKGPPAEGPVNSPGKEPAKGSAAASNMNKINVWLRRHSFLLITLITWLILCVPQNIVTVVMYFYQDFNLPLIPGNFTGNFNVTEIFICYDTYESLTNGIKFGAGILVTSLGCFGVIGNLFSAIVLKRLAKKSGFNKLLFSLGKERLLFLNLLGHNLDLD